MSGREREPLAGDARDPLVELDSHPESQVRNSQPHGIGRVAELGDLVAWNNLGRNVVFADTSFRPLSIYDETAFPDQDEPSQYDLDVHAIVRPAGSDLVLALNHLGTLRAFRASALRAPGSDRRARPIAEMRFVEDAERVVAAGGRLLASRPGSDDVGGLLVSAPVAPEIGRDELPSDPALVSWNRVTALEASDHPTGDPWVAVGAGRRVSIAPLRDGRLGRPRWQVEVPWQSAWLRWDAPVLWVAGSDPPARDVDDHDWNQLQGGGFLALRLEDGERLVERSFDCDLAWGNGGVAVCLSKGAICGLGRTGALHAFRARDGRPLGSSAPLGAGSLGIAHAVAVGAVVLTGFNRAGYRLFARRTARG